MQDLHHARHTFCAVGRQSPDVGTADHHRARPQSQRFGYVRAAADPAVDNHGDLADRLLDSGKNLYGGRNGVEVARAVVAHADRRSPGRHCGEGIVDAQDSFRDDGDPCGLHQPLKVTPGDVRGEQRVVDAPVGGQVFHDQLHAFQDRVGHPFLETE